MFSPIHPERFAQVVELVQNKIVTHSTCQNLLSLLYSGDLRSPKQVHFFIFFLILKLYVILWFNYSGGRRGRMGDDCRCSATWSHLPANNIFKSKICTIFSSYKFVHDSLNLHVYPQVAAFRAGKTKVFSSLGAQLKKACNDRFDMGEATQTLRRLLEKKN